MNGDEYDVADMNNAEDAKKAPAPINARETVTALVNACARWAAYWTDTRDRPRSLESIAADREMSSEGRELASAAMEVRALLAQPPADSVARLVEAGEDVVARIDFARALVDMNGQLRTADVQPAVDSALQLKSALAAHRASLDALGAGKADPDDLRAQRDLNAATAMRAQTEWRKALLAITPAGMVWPESKPTEIETLKEATAAIGRAWAGRRDNTAKAIDTAGRIVREAEAERDSARTQRDEALKFLGERTAERDAEKRASALAKTFDAGRIRHLEESLQHEAKCAAEACAEVQTLKADLADSQRKHEMWVERADKAESEQDTLRADLEAARGEVAYLKSQIAGEQPPTPAYAAADLTQIARMDRIEAMVAAVEKAATLPPATEAPISERAATLLKTAARFVSAGAEGPSIKYLSEPKHADEWIGLAGTWLAAAERVAKGEGAPS